MLFLPLEVQFHVSLFRPIKENHVSDFHRETLAKLFYSLKYATLHNFLQ
jgi:hypothetical protein